MGKLSARKKRVKQRVKIGKVAPETVAHVESLDARVEALQLLIPLGPTSGHGRVAAGGG